MTAPDPELEHWDEMPDPPVTLTCRAGCAKVDRLSETWRGTEDGWVARCSHGTVRSYVSRSHADEMYRSALGVVEVTDLSLDEERALSWLHDLASYGPEFSLYGSSRAITIMSLLRRLGVRV